MHSRTTRSMLALALAAPMLWVSVAEAGKITGTVSYEGRVPPSRKIDMGADPGCAKQHASPINSENIVLGDGQTMANVFVYVKSGASGTHSAPSTPAVIDQKGCRYVPHVLGVMAGQPIKILNSDGLLHNVHALPKTNKEFNMAMPASRTESEQTFDKAEFMFKIKCDVHPWMGAWVAVMDHPFFAVTGTDGKFEIDGLPAGTYTIEAWHELEQDARASKFFQPQTTTVTIDGDGDAKTADFTFQGPEAK